MLKTTVGQFLVNEALPPSVRDYNRVYDKEGLNSVLESLAKDHPDKYREATKRLADIGGEVAFRKGGLTFSPDHLIRPKAAAQLSASLDQQADKIYGNEKLSPEQRRKAVVELLQSNRENMVNASFGEALKAKNPLAIQANMGFRGDKNSVTGQLGGDLLYTDYKGEPIAYPITRSFSQGLSPMEFLAATYGARMGTLSTKLCLSATEKVLMADWSEKPIAEIQVGDRVMGSNLAGKLSPVTVTNVFNNGLRPCYRYLFRVGQSRTKFLTLDCTEDHKVLSIIRPATLSAPQEEASLDPTPLPLNRAVLRKNPLRNSFQAWLGRGVEEDFGKDVPEALLAGLMIGDGCMAPSAHGSYQFSCADDLLIEDTQEYLTQFNLKFSKQSGYGYSINEIVKSPFKREKDGQIKKGHANLTKTWLRDNLGEKKAHEKSLPADVDSWSTTSVAALVAGLFSTDGCVHSACSGRRVAISIHMTARAVVEKLVELLERRFGIRCTSVYETKPDNRVNAVNSLFGFSLIGPESVSQFMACIPLVGKKRLTLSRLLDEFVPSKFPRGLSCKLVTRELLGQLPTFDIEVDNEHHLFSLANGLIVSNSTAEAGALNKQLTQAAHQVVVTNDQHDEDWHTGSQMRGLPVDTLDTANVGAVLSHDIGGYKKNTVLTPKTIRDLHQQGVDRILVRSPLVGGMPDGGIHSRDAGVRNTNGLPVRNTFLGIEAGQAIGEPLSQLQLAAKHQGGVAGSSKVGGFKLIEALANPPKNMPFGATHSQFDGPIERIDENPAGGHDVFIGGKKHFVNSGNALKVSKGDVVEAGDVISEGVPNPREIIKHKGIGEGRQYLMRTLHDAYKENRISSKVLRRNLEPVVRGMVDHVVMKDFWGTHAPEDVVKYSNIEHNWQPRSGFVFKKPSQSVGKYLEEPVLHHSIGTKIRPSMLPEFEKFKVGPIMTHHEPPPFEPHMMRATENLQHDPDWQVRLGGQYLQRGLLDSAHRGLSSSPGGTSFIPGLIRGDNLAKMPKATP